MNLTANVRVITQDDFFSKADLEAMELANESASLFSAAEMMWLTRVITKLRIFPTDEQEQRLLDDVRALAAVVAERKQFKKNTSEKP